MPENTIGKIILEAGSRAQAQTGSGAPGLAGLIGGNDAESLGRRVQKDTSTWQKNVLNSLSSQPKWWTRMFKTMGIQVGLAGILKQSQVFTSTIGSIFQIFGAFVDVMLAPLMPLFIPALRWLARKLPAVSKWAQDFFGVTVKRWGENIVAFFKDPMKHFKTWWTTAWNAVRNFINKGLNAIADIVGIDLGLKTDHGATPKAPKAPGASNGGPPPSSNKPFLIPEMPQIVPGSKHINETTEHVNNFVAASEDGWEGMNKAEKALSVYAAAAAARYAALPVKVGLKLASPGIMGKPLDIAFDAIKKPHQIANAAIKTGVRATGSVLDMAAPGRIPKWAKFGGAVDDAARAGGSGWGALGVADDIPTSSTSWGRNILNKGKGILNNPWMKRAGKALTAGAGPGLKGLDIAEGIYDTKNIIQSDKSWYEGFNPGGWAKGWVNKDNWTPWKKDAWVGDQEEYLVKGKISDAITRATGTAMATVAGPILGGAISTATEYQTGTGYGQDRYGESNLVDAIGGAIKDGFNQGTQHIPGLR